ncbi:hypothetical protein JMM81_10245 [Bacillus sp. V3B]|nr:hypothetical protein [Bacillus sp. V3B]MCQ6275344.1 hypothetical protein [Bacillus sp. V3B]
MKNQKDSGKKQLIIHEKWQLDSDSENGGVRIIKAPNAKPVEFYRPHKK